MQDCKLDKVLILIGTKFCTDKCPKSQEEKEYMECVPYANLVGILMHAMVDTIPNISRAMGVLRRYMVTPRNEH